MTPPPRVQPVDLSRLPAVSAREAGAVRRAGARVPRPSETQKVNVSPFGALSLRCVGVCVPAPPDDADAVWALSRATGDGRVGYLVLDGDTALRLLAGTLALPGPRLIRRLGAAERGIVTATIAACFRACGLDLKIALGNRPWRSEALARLTVLADFGSFREHVRLDVPPDWIPEPSGRALATEAGRRDLPIEVAFELGRTLLTAADWSGADTGDAVVFDIVDAGRSDPATTAHGWTGSIVCGGFAADAVMTPEGRASVTGEFQAFGDGTANAANRSLIEQNGRDLMAGVDRESVSRTVLASAPIEVVAEIGRTTLRADEVLGLGPGSVLGFSPPRGGQVILRVGDQRWAEGELVTVDGQLGVRLTVLARPPGAAPALEADTVR